MYYTRCSRLQETNSFRSELWLMILISTFIIALCKTSIMMLFSKINPLEIICFFWTSFTACLGGKPASTTIESMKSYKMTVFTSLLSGLVIWIAYRSHLTAELSVVIHKNPFDSLEELSKTNWRLILADESNVATKLIMKAEHGSPNYQVNQNNVDENSKVHSKEERIEILLNEPKTAVYCYNGFVIASDAYKNCKVGNVIISIRSFYAQETEFNFRLKKSLAQELGTCQLVWLRSLHTRYSWTECLLNYQKMVKHIKQWKSGK